MRFRWCVLLCVLALAACEPAPLATSPVAPSPAAPPLNPYPVTTAFPVTSAATSATRVPQPLASATPSAPIALPPPPKKPSDLPQAILAYLNQNPANVSNLRAVLAAWGVSGAAAPLPLSAVGDIMAITDIDGDGRQDLIVALSLAEPNSCEYGALALYLRQSDGYRLAQQVGLLDATPIDPTISHVPCPAIFAARDLLGEGRSAVVATSTACGAHTCTVRVDVLRWDGTNLRSLMTQPLPSMAYPEISLQASGRGTTDIVLFGGVIGSVGAGPQRERREVYRWNGTRFALAETSYASSNYLYFKVVDANALLLQKKYPEAIALYQEAIANPRLELSEMHPNERADLQAFSRFRLMVAYALLGDFAQAQAARDELTANSPVHVYQQVAELFWSMYSRKRDVAQACITITNFARAHPEVPAVLSDFGYANPDFTAEDVCPFR